MVDVGGIDCGGTEMRDMVASRSEAEELEESNRKIALLLKELEEQRERSRRAEEALTSVSVKVESASADGRREADGADRRLQDGTAAGPLLWAEHSLHPAHVSSQQVVAGGGRGELHHQPWGGGSDGRGMGTWRHLPSVVTWFTRRPLPKGLDSLYVAKASGRANDHSETTGPAHQLLDVGSVEVVCDELQQLREHESQVWCCAFHPEVLALPSMIPPPKKNTLPSPPPLWYHCFSTQNPPPPPSRSSPQNNPFQVPLLATGSGDKTVRLWRTDGECVRVLRGHKEWVYCLSFSQAGDSLCSGSFDGTLRFWQVASGTCTSVIKRPGNHHGHRNGDRQALWDEFGADSNVITIFFPPPSVPARFKACMMI